jgi:selenocysteine-specific elongation factor
MNAPRDLVLGTAGHIDHGKTALVRALTGVDTDRLPAEKQRGITIDLGYAALELGDVRLAVVDVPGHERFIRNMVAGATGLDLALLVVAADDSVMPQTREHLEVLRLLGLGGGMIALTKCDLVEASWLELVGEEVRALVAGTFLEGAEIVPTSATSGLGIDRLKAALRALAGRVAVRPDTGLFRMAIDRSFTVAGHGTVVTGTVASGAVSVGDDLELFPSGRAVRVRGLQRHDQAVTSVSRGVRAAINLSGVHHSEVVRGHELAAPGYPAPTRVMSVELRTTADAPRAVRHRGRYKVHIGTAEMTATVALLDGPEVAPGGASYAQLFLAGPLVAVHGEPFVLREESPPATLGGGVVLQPLARRYRRRDPVALDRLRRLAGDDPSARVTAVLATQGLQPWTEATLCRDTGLALGPLRQVLEGLTASGAVVELPIGPRRTVRVMAEFAAELEGRVERALRRLHEVRPRQSAVPRSHLSAELPDLGSEALIGGLIDRLRARSAVVADARTVALSGVKPKLSQGERQLKGELADALKKGGFSPPDMNELSAAAGQRAAVVPELLVLLVAEERAVEVGPGLYLDFDADVELRHRVRKRLAGGATMTMAELRDLLQTTRKFAVPVGEYLDRIGLTRREGDVRLLASE